MLIKKNASKINRWSLTVDQMTCTGCEKRIEMRLVQNSANNTLMPDKNSKLLRQTPPNVLS